MKNLIIRTVSGLIYVALIIFSILYSPSSYGILFLIITGLCLWEFYSLLQIVYPYIKIDKIIATFAGLVLFSVVYFIQTSNLPIKYLGFWYIIVFYLFIKELFIGNKHSIKNLAYLFLGQIYIALPLALINFLVFMHTNGTIEYKPMLLLSLFILIWCSDTGAFMVGSTLGKHKLYEKISPNKTWEGTIGGLVFAIIASLILSHYFPENLSTIQWIFFATLAVIFSTIGDLIESMFKRILKVKDSGNMIPGHGGILDRFDSTLFAVPALFLIYILILV